MVGLLVFSVLGWIVAIFCNFLWCKLAKDQNEDWADFCQKLNKEWSKHCDDLINQFYGTADKEEING